MKYFLIAGEASGDLHAACLMKALREKDPAAEFRCYGGEHMEAAGGLLLRHYRTLAYMGWLPVLLHARTILRGLEECKRALEEWQPDRLILVDYAGFNLKIARFARERRLCEVIYYISPKIWAWKERRIKAIRRDVDRLLCILPFEPAYFKSRHGYAATYVGNPTWEEITLWRRTNPTTPQDVTLALLPGSRRQEVSENLSRMLQAAQPWIAAGSPAVVCAAPALEDEAYKKVFRRLPDDVRRHVHIVRGETYQTLSRARLALVTSGTATLETALIGTPQIVCYHTSMGRLVAVARKLFLKVKYISLVNLIADEEIVPELVARDMRPARIAELIARLLPETPFRSAQLAGYARLQAILGTPDASRRAADEILRVTSY